MIKSLMEKKDWKNALKLSVILYNVVRDWNSYAYEDIQDFRNQHGDIDEDKMDTSKPGVFEKILDNTTDLTFVDYKGNKLVDVMFERYLRDIDLVDVSVGKKLLDHGANREFLDDYLRAYLDNDDYRQKEDLRFDVKIQQYIDTGADLSATYIDKKTDDRYIEPPQEIKVKDKVYLKCASLGFPEMLEKVINDGADIFTYFDSYNIYHGLEMSIRAQHDKCTKIIAREIFKRGLLQEKKFTPTNDYYSVNDETSQISVLEYLKQNRKEEILEQIEFVPKPPGNLQVKYEGLSCSIRWESNDQSEDRPVTGYLIEYCARETDDDWETVAILPGSDQTKFDLFGLESGMFIKFRVSSECKNGFSLPATESLFHQCKELPGPPGAPLVQVVNQGKNLDVTWTEPKQVEFFAVTMYSVEGKCGTGEWKEVGRISAEFGAKLRLKDYKKMDINILQVNAIYADGTSVQSNPSETFD